MNYTTNEEKDKFLHKLYYDEKRQVGRDSLFEYISKQLEIKDIPRRYIANWLANQKGQQIYTQRKKPTNIRSINSKKPGAIIQVDLIDFSNQPSAGNYNYILNVIDCFSRKVWLAPLRFKTSKALDTALTKIFNEIQKDFKISVCQSDNGTEFNGDVFQNFDIKHITSRAYTPQQQSLVERSNGTIKLLLQKILYNFSKKKDWRPYISVIQHIYNTSYNRNLKSTPDLAYHSTKEEQLELHEKAQVRLAKSYKEINVVLKVGDLVRIEIPKKTKIEKGKPVYSEGIYHVVKVIPGNKKTFTIPRYKLADEDGVLVKNNFAISSLLVLPDNYVE